MIRRQPPPKIRARKRKGPERSPAYLEWIRSLGCTVCGQPRSAFLQIEAAHTSVVGARGLAQKSSDFSAIPLCFWHHRGDRDSYHRLGERAFAQRHGIDLGKLVLALNDAYGRPRVEQNSFKEAGC